MPNVLEEIPIELKPAAEAALAWINQEHGAQFKLTGLVDPDKAMGLETGQPIELGLVLCEGDLCRRVQVRVEAQGRSFEVSAIEAETPVVPPHLDPPFAVRQGWLDDQLGKHAFIVLLFYRGLW
jgi:hypothetical protein